MPDNPLSTQSASGSLDLSSITESFLNSPEVTGAPPANPPAQEPETPALQTQEEVTPPLQSQTQQETPPPDPEEQHRGYLRDADYRQKTMALAEQRRQLEAQQRQWEQERQQLAQRAQLAQQYEQAVNDPNFLQQQWNRIQAHLQAQNPQATPTVQQVNHLLQEQLTQAKQEIAQYVQQIEVQRNAATFDQQRIDYAHQLIREHPLLEDVEGVDRLISAKAWERHPTNMNELKQFMKEEAEARSAKLQKRIDDNTQAAIMRHEKSKKTSIEPKGGNAPLLQTPQRKHKLGSTDLLSSVMEELKMEQDASR